MPAFTPKPVRVPGCIPTEMRQALQPLAQLVNHMVEGDTINIDVTTVGGDTITEIHNAANLTGELPPAVFVNSNLYIEGSLGGDLSSGGSGAVGSHTVNGNFIRSGYKLPGGTTVGAIWNGTDYSVIAWNVCEVEL